MKNFFEFSNKIIAEATGLIYCGTFNHCDVFKCEQFDKDVGRGMFYPVEYAKIVNKKFDFKSANRETELLIYDPGAQRSVFINVKPEGSFRHQILFERVFYSIKSIPHLTKTGQLRIILADSDFQNS